MGGKWKIKINIFVKIGVYCTIVDFWVYFDDIRG
jgi:hypothetical protein